MDTGTTLKSAGLAVVAALAVAVTANAGDVFSDAVSWHRGFVGSGAFVNGSTTQFPEGLMLGDVYWKAGHNRVITGLKRNSSGIVTLVEISEATGTSTKITVRSAEEFDRIASNEGAIIYRNLELYKNRYTPSDYVAADGESVEPVVYNDDICTFAGDKATFREGDIIVIDYNLKSVGSWTQMELYKDNVLIDTINIDASAHHVNLTSHNLTYGQYKARLVDGNSNFSDYTYWEVLQAICSLVTENRKSTITWSSANGKALYYSICDEKGSAYAHDEITDEERAKGSVEVDLYALISS